MAEYYEWLTPEHSEFGLKKTRDFCLKLLKMSCQTLPPQFFTGCFFAVISGKEYQHNITAIDILPSKYTEVKKRYWSAIKTNETPTQKPTFTDLKQRVSDWIRSNKA
jgi:hypothetical protein